ncbi:hypothetical protein D9M72_179940 [compost metagenome]
MALSSPSATTVTAGSVEVPPVAGAVLMTAALPSIVAARPLPASKRSSACRAVRLPEMAGAVLPATRLCCTTSWMRVCRAQSFSASASGWAAMLIGCGAPCARASKGAFARANATARASGAGVIFVLKRFVIERLPGSECKWFLSGLTHEPAESP